MRIRLTVKRAKALLDAALAAEAGLDSDNGDNPDSEVETVATFTLKVKA